MAQMKQMQEQQQLLMAQIQQQQKQLSLSTKREPLNDFGSPEVALPAPASSDPDSMQLQTYETPLPQMEIEESFFSQSPFEA